MTVMCKNIADYLLLVDRSAVQGLEEDGWSKGDYKESTPLAYEMAMGDIL